MDDASDSTLVECDDQLLVGDRMMVAPLFEGETSRTVILPRGEWHDLWTGKAIAGGQTIEIPASYARIPVYARRGRLTDPAQAGDRGDHTAVVTPRVGIRSSAAGGGPTLLWGARVHEGI
jgi:alpha-glucosidase (family GH31 glycosyl hydrolase)